MGIHLLNTNTFTFVSVEIDTQLFFCLDSVNIQLS